MILGWVCIVKLYLRVAYLNARPTGSTPPKGGIWFKNWAGASKQKLFLGVSLPGKTFLCGLTPPGALRVHPTKRGYMH